MSDEEAVLYIVPTRSGHCAIAWFFDDDQGGTLGEVEYDVNDLKTASREDREHIIATITASKTQGVLRTGIDGYYWESEKFAKAALRVIRVAIKADVAPWPEWAIIASGAGWKPPKGWKP